MCRGKYGGCHNISQYVVAKSLESVSKFFVFIFYSTFSNTEAIKSSLYKTKKWFRLKFKDLTKREIKPIKIAQQEDSAKVYTPKAEYIEILVDRK